MLDLEDGAEDDAPRRLIGSAGLPAPVPDFLPPRPLADGSITKSPSRSTRAAPPLRFAMPPRAEPRGGAFDDRVIRVEVLAPRGPVGGAIVDW